jgi:hypothetical protein
MWRVGDIGVSPELLEAHDFTGHGVPIRERVATSDVTPAHGIPIAAFPDLPCNLTRLAQADVILNVTVIVTDLTLWHDSGREQDVHRRNREVRYRCEGYRQGEQKQ